MAKKMVKGFLSVIHLEKSKKSKNTHFCLNKNPETVTTSCQWYWQFSRSIYLKIYIVCWLLLTASPHTRLIRYLINWSLDVTTFGLTNRSFSHLNSISIPCHYFFFTKIQSVLIKYTTSSLIPFSSSLITFN